MVAKSYARVRGMNATRQTMEDKMTLYQATASIIDGNKQPIAVMKSRKALEEYVSTWVAEWKGRVREVVYERVTTQRKPVFLQEVKIVHRTRYSCA